MAELKYDKDGRLLFTREMKQEYTILMPQMLPVHFGMFRQLLILEGYKVDMLTTNHRGIVDEGLKYVHNDTCYRPRHLRKPVRAREKPGLLPHPPPGAEDGLRHALRRPVGQCRQSGPAL